MSTERANFGDTTFGVIVAIILAFIFFSGDPDIATSLRIWAGKEAGTIPVDYIYGTEDKTVTLPDDD